MRVADALSQHLEHVGQILCPDVFLASLRRHGDGLIRLFKHFSTLRDDDDSKRE
jgi:hypothetical protein